MKNKLISLFILLIIPFVVLALQGDVDGNNVINTQDYVAIRNHIFGRSILTGDKFNRADYNGDGKISAVDYVTIRNMIINKTTPTAVPTVAPTPTPTPDPTPVLSVEEQICESVKGNGSIDYVSFASLKKDKDDYYAIKAAHDCANKYNLPVSITKGEYNIYKKNNEYISVQTNTNFNDSTIYIHDEYSDIYKYMTKRTYVIEPNESNKCNKSSTTGFTNAFSSLAPSTGNYTVYLEEINGKTVYNRNRGGDTTVQDESKSEIYRVYNGVVQDPMFWDYNSSSIEYTVCPIPSNQLVFQNAKFRTITRNKCDKCTSTYMTRGVRVRRNNTKISNIDHRYVDKDLKKIRTIEHQYIDFISVHDAADVIIEKCSVYPLHYITPSGKADSTYDMYFTNAANVLLDYVEMYEDSSHEQMIYNDYWSVMTTAKCKNFTVDHSKLNTVSAHKNIYNLTVRNSTIGNRGIIVAGTGDRKDNNLVVDNVTWKYASKLVRLRVDYGITWNGSITITNGKFTNASSDTVTAVYLESLGSNIGVNYGSTPIYNPTKVTVDGLEIKTKSVDHFRIFNRSKSDYENYYFKEFQRKTNKNESTKISKKNIVGVDKITNYS